ncbi:hypothetical protein MKX01_028762, partial [Papaver californicum]
MAQLHRQQFEVEVQNCSADKLYGFLKDNKTELTKVLPRTHKSVQILAGDGKSAGTVRLWNFVS